MVTHERRGESLWIILDRIKKKNALDLEEWQGIKDGIRRASEKSLVAVITGTDEVFTSGDDLDMAAQHQSVEGGGKMGDQIFEGFRTIETAPVPVIAAINGICLGAGCEIVISCDLAVATEGIEIGLPQVGIGSVPAFAVTRFDQIGGRKRGMELSLLAKRINASTAEEWGLINRVVGPDELESTVEDYADTLSKHPDRAVEQVKRYANNRVSEPDEREQFKSLVVMNRLG